MQATGTLQEARFSKGFILVVIAMLCALVLGAAGGYAVRSAGQASGGATQTLQVSAGGPQSDLTRALPSSAPADPAAGYDISQWAGTSAAQPDHGFIP